MANPRIRYRTDAAFKALRLGHEPGSFDAFLERLKKAEYREEKGRRAIASGAAKRGRRTQLKKPKLAAEKRRREAARKKWGALRDVMHMTFLEQGIDPVGLGGVVTDRDLERVRAVYGEEGARRLRSSGASHRQGYVLTMDDLITARMHPGEWHGGIDLARRNSEYVTNAAQGAIRRIEGKGLVDRAKSDAPWLTDKNLIKRGAGVLFRLTTKGEARRVWLIERLNAIGEPVALILGE